MCMYYTYNTEYIIYYTFNAYVIHIIPIIYIGYVLYIYHIYMRQALRLTHAHASCRLPPQLHKHT